MSSKWGLNGEMKPIIDMKKCSGCRACELFCALTHSGECNPKKAFIRIDGGIFPLSGGYKIKLREGCERCGQCFTVCATGALQIKSGKPKPIKIERAETRRRCDTCDKCSCGSREIPGYAGKILRVDLTNGKIWTEPLDPQMVKDYIGGRGFVAYFLYKLVKAGTKPLSPENIVAIAPGPLTGTFTPAAGKTHFGVKSPLTGGYGDSNMGGHFGPEMRYAGWDALVIEGKSKYPCYLYIEDDRVEIRDASGLWGLGSFETEKILKKELCQDFQIITIGPAGEKLVPFACVSHDSAGRQAGRTGIGAVFGSKFLKAIAVKGIKPIPIFDIKGMIEKGIEMLNYCLSQKEMLEIWQKYGTASVPGWANDIGAFPTRNFRTGHFEGTKGLLGEVMKEQIVKYNKACDGCPMACGKISCAIGKNYNIRVEGPEYETIFSLGSNCGISNIKDVAYLNYLCDELGVDTISTGVIAAFAIECFEKGIITLDDTEGRELKFGDVETVKYLIKSIVYRRTELGNILSMGVKEASKILGGGSEKFAIQIKGLECSGYESRGAPAMALSYMTCDDGATHNRSWVITDDIKIGREILAGKAEIVIKKQHIRPLFDMLGVCRLLWVELGLPEKRYSEIFKAVTGMDYSLEDLLKASERVYNLTRAFWIREVPGFGRDWDQPPARFLEEEIPDGPTKGKKLTQEMVDQLLDDYYHLRGWDKNGIPTKEKLQELGLEEVIPDIYP